MRPIDADFAAGKVKLCSALHGDGAYEAFKRIASEFYKNHTYKFVVLTLDGGPRPDIVTFTAEFWRVSDGANAPQPNIPLTMDELREMDGEPVWVRNHCTGAYACRVIDSSDAHFTYFTDGGLRENRSYGSYWTAYRRKPEEGVT